MIDLDLAMLRTCLGIGVAGNFAGHLEQAGEASDFTAVEAEPDAPKGIFPWFVPGSDTFLGEFPVTHDRLVLPPGADLQIEPEVGLVCDIECDHAGITKINPQAVVAFNDCSIRREGAPKISHKKHWGPASKGVAQRAFPVIEIDPEGATRGLRLACFLRREGETHAYGVDSPLPGYSYYGKRLLDWIVDRLDQQRDEPGTPLEHVGLLWEQAGRPLWTLIGIGATRYTPLGQSTYLQAGDEAVVVVYDSRHGTPEDIEQAVRTGDAQKLALASVLRQTVYAEDSDA